MFNLERREKLIILILAALLLAGILFAFLRNSNRITDVKIRSFNYQPAGSLPVKININEADEKTLSRLDRIGPALARRIIDYRQKNGNFRSAEEIKNVKGIGEKFYDTIKDEISIE